MSALPPLRLYSAVPGVVWPAAPGPAAALRLALQYQLEQSQWFSGEVLQALQFTQLRALLAHAAQTVPYYRDKLAGFDWDRVDAGSEAAFRDLPLLTRAAWQDAGDTLLSGRSPPEHGAATRGLTSGSTGRPIQYATNDLLQLLWQALTLRENLWHHRDFGGKLAAIRARIEPGESNGWGPSADLVMRSGPLVTLDVQSGIEAQLEWLQQQDPDYLLTYPSNLEALARAAHARGVRLPRLRQLRTLGEVLEPRVREACRAQFGAPVIDMYSASEVGYIALQCPQHDHYHVQSETVLVEILRANGSACPAGEAGQVVVTSLHNFSMPIIRYAIGDYAEPGPACSCGRGLPVLRRIFGRGRNMLRLPDGGRRWPVLDYRAYQNVWPIRQLRLRQRRLADIDAEVATDRKPGPDIEALLAQAICRSLGHPFQVFFRYFDELPAGPSGKFEDFVCEIPEASIDGGAG